MKKILNDSQKVHDSIGFQYYAARNRYKPFPYCVVVNADGGKLVYNTMTRGMIFLESHEYDQYVNGQPHNPIAEPLIKRWYMIPKNMDAASIGYMFRQAFNYAANHKLEKLCGYTILTTTDCNARCPYCYEKEYRRRDMSRETAGNVAEYIRETAGSKVMLHWFGGEPLCNMEVIDIICHRLSEYGIPYKSSMITNGYLLDGRDIGTIKGLWKLGQVQITLDGTEGVYNATKGFIYDDPSPFKKVVSNIRLMIENGIDVVARLNVSEGNAGDMVSLAGFLAGEFGDERLFSAYVSPLFNEDSKVLYDGCMEVWRRICSLGIGRSRATPIKKTCCMADSRNSVVITPEGNLGLCEHYADGEYIGDIYTQKLDIPMIESWAERNENEMCQGCPLYPQCIQLKKCPSAMCNERKQEYQINKVKDFMMQAYRKHKERSKNG